MWGEHMVSCKGSGKPIQGNKSKLCGMSSELTSVGGPELSPSSGHRPDPRAESWFHTEYPPYTTAQKNKSLVSEKMDTW